MACNCKNTITSFLGGDVPNPTTFLNCGEADGTYNNPLSTGKTQCVAEDNVLRILDEYKISGTVKNAGEIIFERTYTADTENWDEWTNTGTYFSPIKSNDWKLSASSLNTSANINASGSITTGTHDGSDILYINRYNSGYPYGHIYAGSSSQNTAVGLRFVTRNTLGATEESFSLLGDDRKATFQGNVVISGTNTTLYTLSAKTAINVGNGNGTVSANTFTAPSISIGKESGVVTATTVVAKYSGSVITNAADRNITMTVGKFRPGMVIEVDMGAGSGDVTITTPELANWYYGKYTFLFPAVPNVGGNFVINGGGSEKFYGLTMCLDGNEVINGADTITFGGGKTTAGTKIEIISTKEDRIMMYITSTSNKADVTPS
jgi:hypothetical protein